MTEVKDQGLQERPDRNNGHLFATKVIFQVKDFGCRLIGKGICFHKTHYARINASGFQPRCKRNWLDANLRRDPTTTNGHDDDDDDANIDDICLKLLYFDMKCKGGCCTLFQPKLKSLLFG